jgi:hypothetical protein
MTAAGLCRNFTVDHKTHVRHSVKTTQRRFFNISPSCSAGASGLTSALRLRQKGYRDITVFERSAVPGGKAITFKVENNAGVKDAPLYIAAILGESLPRPCYRTSKGCHSVPQQ